MLDGHIRIVKDDIWNLKIQSLGKVEIMSLSRWEMIAMLLRPPRQPPFLAPPLEGT
jgi:hypothetical protein